MILRCLLVVCCTVALGAQQPPSVDRAWDLVAAGRRDEAIALLRRLVKTAPANPEVRLLLGSLLMEAREEVESLVHLEEAVRLQPQSAIAHNSLGEAYHSFGRTKAARAEFEKTVKLDPKISTAHELLGQILLEAGEYQPAALHLDRALALFGRDPESAHARYLRAKIHTEENQIDKAVAQLKLAVKLRPDFAEAWSDLGQAHKAQLDDASALACFEKAVALAPDGAVARTRLGAEYVHQGQAAKAVPHLRVAVRLDPNNQMALYNLQLALREDGQLDDAAKVKQQLADLLRRRDKESQDAAIAVRLNNEGAVLEKAGNLAAAVEKYQAALALDPEHVGIRTNFAAALLRLGRWEQGVTELRESLRRDPENVALRTALEQALAHRPKSVPQ